MFQKIDILELLNYGTGTAISVILVLLLVWVMFKLVNNQSSMIEKMSITLKDIAASMLVIQDNIKDLQDSIKYLEQGQDKLWKEIKFLKGGRSYED